MLMIRRIIIIFCAAILTSCTMEKEAIFVEKPDTINGDFKIVKENDDFNQEKKEFPKKILCIFDDEKYLSKKDELGNAAQIAFAKMMESSIQSAGKRDEIFFEHIGTDKYKGLLKIAMDYNEKNVTHVIAFLEKPELENVKFLFKHAKIISMLGNSNDLIDKYVNRYEDEMLYKIANVVKDKNKIIFVDYDYNLQGRLYANLVNLIQNRDVLFDTVIFNQNKVSENVNSFQTNNVDAIIFNVSFEDAKKILAGNWFNGTVVFMDKFSNEISELQKISDAYFVFLDFEIFKTFANKYTEIFQDKIPSFASYFLYELLISILSNKELENSLGNLNFQLYRKMDSKIIKI